MRRLGQALVEQPALGIHQNLPPETIRLERLARFGRSRRARVRARAFGIVESRGEDGIVDGGEPRRLRVSAARSRPRRKNKRERQERGRRAAAFDDDSVRQRSLLLSVALEASSTRRSSSCGYGSPLASHIFEYMLIVVKPGIVFTSFR